MTSILVAEDSRTQAEELRLILEADGLVVTVARDGQQALDRFRASTFDLVISDILMPGLTGYELCQQIKADPSRAVPVILLTSLTDPEDIIRGLECGADNFLTKPFQPDHLLGRVRHILANQALRDPGRLQVETEVFFLGRKLIVSSDKVQILNLLATTFEDIVRANRRLQESQADLNAARAAAEEYARRLEDRVRERTADLARANEELRQEVEERRRAEEALHGEREFLKAVLENVQDGIVACDARGTLTLFNEAARQIHGRPEEPLPPEEWAEHYNLFLPDGQTPMPTAQLPLFRALQGEVVLGVEVVIAPAQVLARIVLAGGQPILDAQGRRLGAVAVMHDVTERRRLEEQVRQTQKMEAIGQLAGGVAHDFNNLLTVINGYSDLLLPRFRPDDPYRGFVEEIRMAGERAAGLTRQLLAFSRKQVLQPRVLDLNALVADAEKLLHRLIGEDVALTTTLDPTLGLIKADPGQLEQIILNLAVNARDALPRGGQLTIETRNVELDQSYTGAHLEVRPGAYVLLAISDTGVGMDAATQARIFEPFFTTKGPGKGTGLGLATVYGIVKQSAGNIGVYSEPGRGTTFKIYLPRVDDAGRVQESAAAPAATSRGTESILLVEDEAAVRALAGEVLREQGYTVLEAVDGVEALRLAQAHAGPIHLLVTDVIMPRLSGRALVENLTSVRPSLKVLYLSGYTDDAVVRHGVLEAETDFLQKPFRPADLVQRVREVLDRVRHP